jgi:hypothetical protein
MDKCLTLIINHVSLASLQEPWGRTFDKLGQMGHEHSFETRTGPMGRPGTRPTRA